MDNKRNTPPLYNSDTEKAEDIINNGEYYERMALALRHEEKPFLTEEQNKRLLLSFKTPKEKKAYKNARYIFIGALKYGRHLYTLKKLYQAEAEALAKLCTQWEGYDNQAKTIDLLVDVIQREYFSVNEYVTPMRIRIDGEVTDPLHSKENFEIILNSIFNVEGKDKEGKVRSLWEGVVFKAIQDGTEPDGKPTYRTFADIFGKGGLYEKIEEKRQSATDYLQYLKSGMEQYSDFLTSKAVREAIGLKVKDKINPYSILLPRSMEVIMKYPDYISFMDDNGTEKYFSFILKERRDKGEKITPEEERRAVIPDYNQVEPTDKYLAIEKDWLESYFSIFML